MRHIKTVLIFILLTLFTEIGGIIYLLSKWLMPKSIQNEPNPVQRKLKRWGFHIIVYLIAIFLFVPPVAALFGRVPLTALQKNNIGPRTFFTVLLNRRYVRPELKESVYQIAVKMGKIDPTIKINYFDANFPFYLKLPFVKKGFPLFPHLSHHDGKKLDIGFIYNDVASGKVSTVTPSAIGYGISEEPKIGEVNRPEQCANHWMYSFMRNIYPQGAKKNYDFNLLRSKQVIEYFIADKRIDKILLEPHLTTRLSLNHGKIRAVQCGSVRHDDHFHVQVY